MEKQEIIFGATVRSLSDVMQACLSLDNPKNPSKIKLLHTEREGGDRWQKLSENKKGHYFTFNGDRYYLNINTLIEI